jgi:hypothetical protein
MPDRQRYISRYLTHFTGRTLGSDDERYKCLSKILKDDWISCLPHDKAAQIGAGIQIRFKENISESRNRMFVPDMVCFCDIPIGDLHIHTEKYSRFGLAFDKEFIASRGGGPVYYFPIHAAPVWPVGEDSTVKRKHVLDRGTKDCYGLLEELICDNNQWSAKAREVQSFLYTNIFAYMCCFDHGLADNHPDNYYLEREWRILGRLEFHMSNVRRILLPEKYARRFREDFPEYYGELVFL